MAFAVTQGAHPRSFSTSRAHLTGHAQGHWPSTFFGILSWNVLGCGLVRKSECELYNVIWDSWWLKIVCKPTQPNTTSICTINSILRFTIHQIQPKRADGEENHKRRPMPALFQLHDTRSLQPPSPTSEKFCPLASHPLSPQSECLRSRRRGVSQQHFLTKMLWRICSCSFMTSLFVGGIVICWGIAENPSVQKRAST